MEICPKMTRKRNASRFPGRFCENQQYFEKKLTGKYDIQSFKKIIDEILLLR